MTWRLELTPEIVMEKLHNGGISSRKCYTDVGLIMAFPHKGACWRLTTTPQQERNSGHPGTLDMSMSLNPEMQCELQKILFSLFFSARRFNFYAYVLNVALCVWCVCVCVLCCVCVCVLCV